MHFFRKDSDFLRIRVRTYVSMLRAKMHIAYVLVDTMHFLSFWNCEPNVK